MRELTTHFYLIEPEDLADALRMGENTFIPQTARHISCIGKVVYSQSPSQSDAGTKYSHTFRGVTEDSSVMRFNGNRAYIGIILSDGRVSILGSADEAPLITVTPNPGVFVLETSFDTVQPIEL